MLRNSLGGARNFHTLKQQFLSPYLILKKSKIKEKKRLRSLQKKRKPAPSPAGYPLQIVLQQALALHQKGRLLQAETLYRKILQVEPNHPYALHYLGLLAYQTGNNGMAVELISRALTLRPDNIEGHNTLGNALLALGKAGEAAASYRQALALDPDCASVHYNLGNALRAQNKMAEAVASYRQAIALKPDYFEAYYDLGILLESLGKPGEAEASFRRVLELKPDLAGAHNNLGFVLESQGELDEAEASYRQALALKPDFVEALTNLGNVLLSLSKPESAEECYRRALTLSPDNVEGYNNLGLALHQQGKSAEAVAYYRQALALKPNFAKALSNLGNALLAIDEPEKAEECYRRALSLRPDFAEVYNNLGMALHDQGKLEEAAASFRRALELQPDFAEAHNNLGMALNKQGQLEEAAASFHRALELRPDFAEPYNNLGHILNVQGKLEEAAAHYHQALSLKPDYAEAYRNLSAIERHNNYDCSIKRMEDLYTSNDLSGKAKIHLGFALGKIFKDLKRYDKSFDFIVEANQLQRQSYEYSIQDDQELFAKIENIFSAEFFSSRQGVGNPDTTPILIVGMPRSGTTLVEQILASHPLVFGAGELSDLADLVVRFCSGESAEQFPECVRRLDAAALKRMGSDYIGKIRRHKQEARYITDKMPHNFLYVGLIKVILPKAKIIHCRRDPMDNCLSIFKNYFSERGSHKYAYKMDELGRYYRIYSSLMEHWERVLPGYMYSLSYEDLVFDQQSQTLKLLEFCGLPWDDACLAFHKTKRIVLTASSVQVRQPMNSDSIRLWKRYESQLEPLRDVLGYEVG